jgi:hypothetical protein
MHRNKKIEVETEPHEVAVERMGICVCELHLQTEEVNMFVGHIVKTTRNYTD